eukprot:13049900-Alexandrium_andersonii.AAC.1
MNPRRSWLSPWPWLSPWASAAQEECPLHLRGQRARFAGPASPCRSPWKGGGLSLQGPEGPGRPRQGAG